MERSKLKVAEKVTESDLIKVNEKVCKEVSGKEAETSLYAGKAPNVKAANEIDLSKGSHAEEVEADSDCEKQHSI